MGRTGRSSLFPAQEAPRGPTRNAQAEFCSNYKELSWGNPWVAVQWLHIPFREVLSAVLKRCSKLSAPPSFHIRAPIQADCTCPTVGLLRRSRSEVSLGELTADAPALPGRPDHPGPWATWQVALPGCARATFAQAWFPPLAKWKARQQK